MAASGQHGGWLGGGQQGTQYIGTDEARGAAASVASRALARCERVDAASRARGSNDGGGQQGARLGDAHFGW
jgi:hypothetical protein